MKEKIEVGQTEYGRPDSEPQPGAEAETDSALNLPPSHRIPPPPQEEESLIFWIRPP